ncbi:MAG: response regulator [Anaerolineales bacterium]|nr:response regulator [Anaerolineales bacterium]
MLVLLADDSEQTVEVIGDYLQSAGCKVVIARRGTEAVRMAETMHPDVIVMDIQMPGMDGLTAIKRIRTSADALVAAIPVIAATALAMPGDRERCLEAGANDYMSKPMSLGRLLAQIVEITQTTTQSRA